jgi:serine/threonine-protein kinase
MTRILLGVFAGVLSAGFVILLVYDLAYSTGGEPLGHAAMAALMAAAATLLFARPEWEWSPAQLRVVEIAVFATVAAYLAVQAYGLGVADLQAGGASSAWYHNLLRFTLLMVAYAVFVPNSVARAGAGVAAIGLTPLLVAWLIRIRHPELQAAFDAAASERAFDSSLLLAAGAIIAVAAAAVIDKYLAVAYESRRTTFYELHELIGSGGMGEVWKASHRTLARPAAVKLIRADKLDAADKAAARQILQRFEREALAAARLRSPHTVAIYDAGVTGDGHFFYAMEYLEGLDLEDLIGRFGPVPAERAVHLLMQACDSLADAHEHGMTHRDIKPANLHLSRRGPGLDFVKLLDFGLVQTDTREEDSTQLTAEGTTSGTPAYMAPEMAVRRNGVDGRADIYALGCVAYWLLTGTRVFEGDTGVALIVEHVKTAPIPPSRRTELPIPAELERIVMKCLEKDPADRFASARELAAALAAIPVPAPWNATRADQWWQLHMPPAAA